MRSWLGAHKAITTTAHILARIIYHLLAPRESYDESVFTRLETAYRQRAENRLRFQARALGFVLSPTSATASPAQVPQKQLTRGRG
jgi:hypothetical protein